jgi:hypothetical protein
MAILHTLSVVLQPARCHTDAQKDAIEARFRALEELEEAYFRASPAEPA